MSFEQSIRCLAKNCKTAPYLAASVLKSSCLSLFANRSDYCPYLTARHCPTHWSILVCCCGPLTILFYSILSWLPGKSLMLQVEADYLTSCNVWRSSIGSIGASTITWLIVWLCVCIVCRRHLKNIKAKEPSCTHYIIIYFNASVLYIVLCIMYIYIYIFLFVHIYIYIPCICQLWANICQPHPQWFGQSDLLSRIDQGIHPNIVWYWTGLINSVSARCFFGTLETWCPASNIAAVTWSPYFL